MKKIFLLMLGTVLFSSIGRKRDASDFDYKKIEKIADSIKIQNITVHNLFKSQILAHRSKDFDSAMITRNVYLPHRKLWDSCYGAIFGDDNVKLFHNEKGLMGWNRTLFKKEKPLIADIYRLTSEEVLRKSNYDGYIEKL